MKVYVGDHVYEHIDAERTTCVMRGDSMWIWNGWTPRSFGAKLCDFRGFDRWSFYEGRSDSAFLSRRVSR